MPRGIPNASGNSISKMEGVRRALAHLGDDAMPLAIQKYLKKEHGIVMDNGAISNYKSAIKTAAKSAVIRKPSVASVAPAPAAVTAHSESGGITLEEIRAVKAVVDKFGAGKVRQLADVFAK
jgi:hypothetical protein